MNPSILREFLRLLTCVRLGDYSDRTTYCMSIGRCFGFSSALYQAGIITIDQHFLFDDLAMNAVEHAGEPFPSALNAGPVMPADVALKRRFAPAEVVPRVPAKIPTAAPCPSWLDGGLEALEMVREDMTHVPVTVSAPASRPELRLLCLLVTSRTGETRSIPVHTLRPMPPRVLRPGRWSLASDPAFLLRETQAIRPTPEVLERYSRQRQANAVCADSRAVRAEGVSYVRLPS